MAMSKPVVTLILSLQHELTSKGIRVQVVLPGRTATDGWDVAGFPWSVSHWSQHLHFLVGTVTIQDSY
jgi:short-subunit dehydrogenase